jgi:ABC-type transport system substrate-binding protein
VGLGVDTPLGLADSLPRDATVETNDIAIVNYVGMNVAEPPFDDVHVRRAFSLALDKADLVARTRGLSNGLPLFQGTVARHLIPDALEDNLLDRWRPSWDVAPDGGDIDAARAEMVRSTYDTDGDGRCDGAVCDEPLFVVDNPYPQKLLPPYRVALQALGIAFNVRRVCRGCFAKATGPTRHVALQANRWQFDFPTGSNLFPLLFYGPNLEMPSTTGRQDPSLLGATTEQLASWGYRAAEVASADTAIERCDDLAGDTQVACWAELDRSLMENVVPWVAWEFQTTTRLASPRVQRYVFDQFANEPALDRIALTPGSP